MPTASPSLSPVLACLASLALLLGVAACTLGTDEADTEADTESVALDDTPEGDPGDGGAEPTPAENGDVPSFERDVPVPGPVPLDLEVRHASGTVARLNGLSFTQSSIDVDVTIINGWRNEQILNNASRGGIVLEDDRGNGYAFIAPSDNPRLSVEPGERLDGTLTFAGRLAPEATSLTLTFNPEGIDEPHFTPRILFEAIPVPQ